MFSNTKKNRLRHKIIAIAVSVAVMIFGIWLNFKEVEEESETEDTIQEVIIDADKEKTDESETGQNENTSTISTPDSYLIREEAGVVKVYLCDDEGNNELYLITSIPFELLSESDQEMFRKGVSMDAGEDLGKFLENFDS